MPFLGKIVGVATIEAGGLFGFGIEPVRKFGMVWKVYNFDHVCLIGTNPTNTVVREGQHQPIAARMSEIPDPADGFFGKGCQIVPEILRCAYSLIGDAKPSRHHLDPVKIVIGAGPLHLHRRFFTDAMQPGTVTLLFFSFGNDAVVGPSELIRVYIDNPVDAS
jgi:hypothetical protein